MLAGSVYEQSFSVSIKNKNLQSSQIVSVAGHAAYCEI